MCRAIDEWLEDVKREGKAEGRVEGKAEGRVEGKAEGKAEGKMESILTLLEDFGEIPDSLQKRIRAQKNADMLKNWLKLAARAKSIGEFSAQI